MNSRKLLLILICELYNILRNGKPEQQNNKNKSTTASCVLLFVCVLLCVCVCVCTQGPKFVACRLFFPFSGYQDCRMNPKLFISLLVLLAEVAVARKKAEYRTEPVPVETPTSAPRVIKMNPASLSEADKAAIADEEMEMSWKLQLNTKEKGKDDIGNLPLLEKLGRIQYKLSNVAEALKISKEIVRLSKIHYGAYEERTIRALVNLASVLHKKGDTDDAIDIMVELFPIQLQRHGEGSKEMAFHIGKISYLKLLNFANCTMDLQ